MVPNKTYFDLLWELSSRMAADLPRETLLLVTEESQAAVRFTHLEMFEVPLGISVVIPFAGLLAS